MAAAKKPLTPFFRFCAEEREEHAKKSESKLSAKELGEKWRALSEEDKQEYRDAYNEEKEKYDSGEAKKENSKRKRSKEKREETESNVKAKGKKTNHGKKK